jgi:hypothetical protein
MARKSSTEPKRSVWDDDYKPYGTYKGSRGNPQQWKQAYEERMGAAEAAEVLRGQFCSAREILGVALTATWAEMGE